VRTLRVTLRGGRPLHDPPLPPAGLRFMQEDDTRLVSTGDELADLVLQYQPRRLARRHLTILDVGCGYGRLATGLSRSRHFHGSYLGFDLLPRHLGWCQENLTAHDPRLRFLHVDLHNGRYNPTGTLDPDAEPFPVPDDGVDECALFSVFTHLYRETIEHYLREIARVLHPGGTAVTTWLLFDEDRLAAVTAESSSYPLVHLRADGARYQDESDPLRAIGYPIADLRAMADAAGLIVTRLELGSWPGGDGRTFQDLVVLQRPSARRVRLLGPPA
jgi:SAM-dependent methyltransferase